MAATVYDAEGTSDAAMVDRIESDVTIRRFGFGFASCPLSEHPAKAHIRNTSAMIVSDLRPALIPFQPTRVS